MIKNFVKDIVLFIVSFFLLLFLISNIIDKGLRKNDNDWYGTWNNIYNSKINADVLIIGTSRASVHISPKILDSILQYKSYNFGENGSPFLLQNCRFKVFLEHNPPPKTIIQCLDIFTLDKATSLPNAQSYLPYINDSLIKHYTTNYKGGFNFLDFYFPLYKYNNNIELAYEGVQNFFNKNLPKSSRVKGYIAITSNYSDNRKDTNIIQNTDTETIKEFEEYLAYCKKNAISVILVYTPEHISYQKRYTNRQFIINLYIKYSQQYGYTFLDYSNDSLTLDTKYFYNLDHLNKKGSEIFSTQLALDIKKIYK